MKSIRYSTSNVATVATNQRRQQVLRRVKLGDAVADIVASLAYPVDPDIADRRPAVRLLDVQEAQS